MKPLTTQDLDASDAAEEAFTRTSVKSCRPFMSKVSLFTYAQTDINEQRQSPLFSLPGEIRNKIMEHLLVPGKLYLRNPVPKRDSLASHASGWSGNWDCGLAYLATCRLAHQEGHEYYYGRNMFYLPRGDISDTLRFFHVLDPKHSALISSLGVEIGLFNLTVDIFDAEMRYPFFPKGNSLRHSDCARAATRMTSKVQEIWLCKLGHIQNCQGYREIKVQFGKTALLLSGQDLVRELSDILGWFGVLNVDDCNRELSHILRQATLSLRRNLEGILFEGGREAARNWVIQGCLLPRP